MEFISSPYSNGLGNQTHTREERQGSTPDRESCSRKRERNDYIYVYINQVDIYYPPPSSWRLVASVDGRQTMGGMKITTTTECGQRDEPWLKVVRPLTLFPFSIGPATLFVGALNRPMDEDPKRERKGTHVVQQVKKRNTNEIYDMPRHDDTQEYVLEKEKKNHRRGFSIVGSHHLLATIPAILPHTHTHTQQSTCLLSFLK